MQRWYAQEQQIGRNPPAFRHELGARACASVT